MTMTSWYHNVILNTDNYKHCHYALYPLGTKVSAAECAHIEEPSKLMCIALAGRLACKDAFKLPP